MTITAALKVKLCKDCKFLSGIRCAYNDPPQVLDYVNGGMRFAGTQSKSQEVMAQEMREHGACGHQAKFWEPKS